MEDKRNVDYQELCIELFGTDNEQQLRDIAKKMKKLDGENKNHINHHKKAGRSRDNSITTLFSQF